MRTLEQLIEAAMAANVRLQVNADGLDRVAGLSADTLFHTPLIALAILVVTHARHGELRTSELATWTLAVLAERFDPDGGTRSRLKWSVSLRARCADGLAILETVGLVDVVEGSLRRVSTSATGRALLSDLRVQITDVGALVRSLAKAHERVRLRGLELL